VFGVISATYTDHGVNHDNVQTLSTTGQTQIRQKHQEVEFVVNQSGTTTATNTCNERSPILDTFKLLSSLQSRLRL
jgi:hypothetical protein